MVADVHARTSTAGAGVPRIRHRCRGWSPEQRLAFFAEGGAGRDEYPADVCNEQLRMLAEKRGRKIAKVAKFISGNPDRLDLTPAQRHALDGQLERITPSWTWADDMRGEVASKRVELKSDIAKELNRKAVFPPGGDHATLMRQCSRCGGERWFPPQYLHTGARRPVCSECFEHGRAPVDERDRRKSSGGDRDIRTTAWGIGAGGVYEAVELVEEMPAVPEEPLVPESVPSLTAVAMAALADRGAVMNEIPLDTEDVRVLQSQLRRFAQGKATSLYDPDANFRIP